MFRTFILILLVSVTMQSCGSISLSAGSEEVEKPATKGPDTAIVPPDSQGAAPDNLSNQDASLIENGLNRSLPDDVIKEIVFFGGMGGGGGGCWEEDYKIPTGLYWESFSEYPRELMQEIGFTICGVMAGEEVKMKVRLPDGRIEESQAIARTTDGRDRGEVSFTYIPFLYDPAGIYKFTFHGENWSMEYPFTVEFTEPDSARLYLYQSQIYLYKFFPKERVRLLIYSINNLNGNRKLIGWKEIQVNATGELQISTELENVEYVALGDITGEVREYAPGESFIALRMGDVYCDGARKPVGIKPDGYAEVLEDVLPTYEWDSAKRTWVKTGETNIGKGTVVYISSNAICVSGIFLWTINCPAFQCQFLAPESGPDGYYLRPVDAPPPTPKPEVTFSCPRAPNVRIEIGKNARVTFTDGTPLRVRNKPGNSSKVIEKIPEGTQFFVFDGPQCLDGFVWWRIELDSGIYGWVAEGDEDSYFIEPVK
jgi:hypothetical protein